MIIVTGANGFIGSNLCLELYRRGESVLGVDYVIDRPYLLNTSIGFFLANDFYSHMAKFLNGREVTAIFHEGAISSTTETNVKLLFERNMSPTMDLMYFCRDHGIPLQYASSASVYGNLSREQWHRPHKPTNPLNEYAKSKKSGDYLAEWIIDSRKPPKLFQGMRYFNVHGPNEDHKGNQASPYHKFSKQLEESGRLRLFEGSKEFYRDFISVEQVIAIKLAAIENNPSGIYDVGTAKPKSFYDVACEVCSQHNISDPDSVIDWIPMPDNLKEHYQTYSCADMLWLKK